MRPSLSSILAYMFIIACPSAAKAESLADAWDAALESHQQLAAAVANRDAARLDVKLAKSERLPRVDIGTAFTQLDSAPRFAFGDSFVSPKLFSGDSMLTSTAQATVPLFTSGLVSHGISAAEAASDATESQLAAVRQDIKLSVAMHYIQVQRAERALRVADSNVTTLTAHSNDAKNQFDAGAVAQNDYLAASVSLADAKQRRIQATNSLELAHAHYNRVLGRPLDTPVRIDAKLGVDTAAVTHQDVTNLTDIALSQRPELATIESQARALTQQSEVERARSRPQLGLTGGYTFLENNVLDDDEFWSIGVGFQWRLFDSGRSKSRAQALARRASAARHEREDLATRISLQVRQAWLDRDEAANRQSVAIAAVEQANENLRVARDRYRAGAGTNTDVLDAEALRTHGLNNRDNAQLDLVLAQIRLAHAVGAL